MLGFAFDADGRMIAADAMPGLLAIMLAGEVSLLTDRVGADNPIGYANSVVVAKDGIIRFTDSSTRFAPAAWGSAVEASVFDVLEQSATGRILAQSRFAEGRDRDHDWRPRERPMTFRHIIKGRLGFGTAPFGNMFRAIPQGEARETAEAAWNAGIRYFDRRFDWGRSMRLEFR